VIKSIVIESKNLFGVIHTVLRMQPHVVPVYNLVVYYKLTLAKVVLTNTKKISGLHH